MTPKPELVSGDTFAESLFRDEPRPSPFPTLEQTSATVEATIAHLKLLAFAPHHLCAADVGALRRVMQEWEGAMLGYESASAESRLNGIQRRAAA